MSAARTPRAFSVASTRASLASAVRRATRALGAVAETPRVTSATSGTAFTFPVPAAVVVVAAETAEDEAEQEHEYDGDDHRRNEPDLPAIRHSSVLRRHAGAR